MKITNKAATEIKVQHPAVPQRVQQLREENLKLRRVLMEQPDYSPLIIQLGEAILSNRQDEIQAAADAYHAWQEGEV